jgi:hypothetical protein
LCCRRLQLFSLNQTLPKNTTRTLAKTAARWYQLPRSSRPRHKQLHQAAPTRHQLLCCMRLQLFRLSQRLPETSLGLWQRPQRGGISSHEAHEAHDGRASESVWPQVSKATSLGHDDACSVLGSESYIGFSRIEVPVPGLDCQALWLRQLPRAQWRTEHKRAPYTLSDNREV